MNFLVELNFLIYSTLFVIILSLTLNPIIFWICVIPQIEERVGQRLKFNPAYSVWPLGKYLMGYMEASTIISIMYLNFKIFRNKIKLKFHKSRAITPANYDVQSASRTEIIMSLIFFFCTLYFVLAMFLMFLIPRIFPLH